MDDPGWSWPAWKFGMRREDLFTKLHDQYNTFASAIQDPEAFHHDVYEISVTASTCDEFHRLLASRKEQRMRELNESLESASVEIIANPKLIGTQQWQHALQLFRTRSLDSLVRYFSSYLPDDHPWHHPQTQNEALSKATFSDDTVDDDESTSRKPFFDDRDHDLAREPLSICTSIPASHLPPSPRSLTMYSDSSAASPIDMIHHEYSLNSLPPSRTLSFSEPESDAMLRSGLLTNHDDEEEISQSDEPDTPTTSISDISDARSLSGSYRKHVSHDEPRNEPVMPAVCDDSVEESVESDTPTPRTEMDACLAAPKLAKRSKSVHRPSSPLYTQVLHEYVRSSRKSRRDGSLGWPARRTSPEVGRVQKSQPDLIRARPKGRRCID